MGLCARVIRPGFVHVVQSAHSPALLPNAISDSHIPPPYLTREYQVEKRRQSADIFTAKARRCRLGVGGNRYDRPPSSAGRQ